MDVQNRYKIKVQTFCGNIDPFTLDINKCVDVDPLPRNVGYFDLVNYCIETDSSYTQKSFKALNLCKRLSFSKVDGFKRFQVESFSNNCLLCLKHSDDLFKIFGSRGIQLNTVTILKDHFWFEVSESDEKSICEECWWTVQNFHEFYNSVKLNHQHQSISEVKLIFIDANHANKHNKTVDLLDPIKDEPNIDTEIDIGECSSDIPDTLHTLAVRKSSTESKSIKSVIIDANKHNKIVDLLDTIKHEPNIEIENGIDYCSPDIPDAKESCMESELNRATDLPVKIRRKRPKTSVQPSTKTIAKICKSDCHTAILSTYFDMSCDLCGDALPSFSEMKRHYKYVHNVKEGYLVCCNQKFIRLQHMLQHCQWHMNPNIFKCDDCPKTFNTKDKLRRHTDNCHVADNKRKFRCKFCEKKFLYGFSLCVHIRSRHSSQSSVAAQKKITKPRSAHKNVDSHICEVCAKPYNSRRSYEIHYMRVHMRQDTNTAQKFQCDICGKWLKNRQSMRLHLLRHRSKTETCSICGRVSRNYRALQAHIRFTHREATLECVVCGKMFKKQHALKEHMAIHAGITDLYKCTFCEKTCRSSANMYTHQKRAHPNELEQKKTLLNSFTPATTE